MATGEIRLGIVEYDDADVQRLVAEVQAEYTPRYGRADASPLDPAEFRDERGMFLLARIGADAVAIGGWRWGGPRAGDGEIRRMYVRSTVRRRGLARLMLGAIERSAREHGVTRLVLETGLAQPEAMALYRDAGYSDIDKFGYYRDSQRNVCLAKYVAAL